jgi:hypothetical protein
MREYEKINARGLTMAYCTERGRLNYEKESEDEHL